MKKLALTQSPHQLFNKWKDFIDASPKTIATYTGAVRRFLHYLDSCGISHPIREDIVRYRDYLAEGHKPTTVQAYLTAVKLFFKWTEREGLYPNVAERVKGVKLDSGHKKDYLTSHQAGNLLQSIDRSTLKGLRDYAIISLMVTTGLRTISIVRANIGDLGVAGDSPALYFQGKGRSGKSEYVKLAEPVEKAIREYLQARGVLDADAPLFGSLSRRNIGCRLTTRSISRICKGQFAQAGLVSNRITAHSLRHTAATLNLLAGATVQETQQLLGHRNINTTLIYSHALERAKNDSEFRIAKAIGL